MYNNSSGEKIFRGGGDRKQIILFGTGALAERFYNRYKDTVDIKFCLDNDIKKQKEKFHDLEIYNPYSEDVDITKYKIVIASMYYSEIDFQLTKLGLMVYDNYIASELFNKKIAIIHGNCNTSIIMEYLINNNEFLKTYGILQTPRVYLFDTSKGESIDERLLKKCDLFIYQHIRKENPYGYQLSSEYILKLLPDKCKRISIPAFSFTGYFPQITFDSKYQRDKYRLFSIKNKDIIKFVEDGKTIDEVIELLKRDDLYTKEYIINNFEQQINIIKEREKKTDIKIVDYIEDNIKKELLFYDCNHPVNKLLKEITKRILKEIGVNNFDEFDKVELVDNCELDECQIPIYPCVIKYLGLEFKTDRLRVHKMCERFNNRSLTFEDYVREYINSCCDII